MLSAAEKCLKQCPMFGELLPSILCNSQSQFNLGCAQTLITIILIGLRSLFSLERKKAIIWCVFMCRDHLDFEIKIQYLASLVEFEAGFVKDYTPMEKLI